MNRQEALHEACARLRDRQIADPYPEAELLLTQALGIDKAELYASLRDPVSESRCRRYWRFIERRATHEPAAYIIGRREFFGLDFCVDSRVLVPRPETELLVETAIKLAVTQYAGLPLTVADVGTGSGAIAICLAKHLPLARIYATDISCEALEVASINCARHGVADQVTLAHGNLLDPLLESADLIVANLPYVARHTYDTLPPEIRAHEPEKALNGGEAGLDFIFKLLEQSPAKIGPRGSIILEIGADQAQALVAKAFAIHPNARIEVRKDLASLDRVIVVALSP